MKGPDAISLARANAWFQGRGLVAERMPAGRIPGKRAPDFQVYSSRGELFFCEVKALSLRMDPETNCFKHTTTLRKLADHVVTAAEQFGSVNKTHMVPNVLFWNSDHFQLNFSSLIMMLRGYLGVEGREFADFKRLRSIQKARANLATIDLHIWLQGESTQLVYIPTFTEPFRARLLIRMLSLESVPITNAQSFGL